MKYIEAMAHTVAYIKFLQLELPLEEAFILERAIEVIYAKYWDDPLFNEYVLDYMEEYLNGNS